MARFKKSSNTKPLSKASRVLFVVLGLVGLLGFASLWLFAKVLRVTQIRCTLTTGDPCPAAASTKLQPLHNTPLLFVDTNMELESALAGSAFSLHTFHKELPNVLVVALESHPAVFSLQVGDVTHWITAAGTTTTTEPQTAVPHILYQGTESPFTDSQALTPDLLSAAVALGEALSNHHLSITSSTWHSHQEIRLELTSGHTAIVDATNTAMQIENLAILLQSDETQESLANSQEIDLRFTHPVLRTRQ